MTAHRHGPAWPLSVFQSADVQIAAADLAAIEAGEFLAVVGDFHPGNPLTQSLFSTRFPDPDGFRVLWHADVGQPVVAPTLMRNPITRVTSRNIADATNPDGIHLLGPRITPIHVGYNSLQIADLAVRGDEVGDPAGTFRAPLTDLLFQPMFISAMRTFEPFAEVGPRITVGRTVLRRGQTSLRRLREPRAHAQPTPAARPVPGAPAPPTGRGRRRRVVTVAEMIRKARPRDGS